MIKDGKKVETKSMVCTECITLMTPRDFAEHDGKCQLCRSESKGLYHLYVIAYYDGDEHETTWRVYDTDNYGDAETRFVDDYREEYGLDSDWEFEYIDVNRITNVNGHPIVVL